MYMRSWIPDADSFRGGGFRSIRRSTSPDFLHWEAPRQIDLGDSTREHLYTNACVQYFRAPHVYMMFPRRFVPERQFHDEPIPNGASDGVFMTSRDGIRWDRRFMEPFLPPGPDPDNWTDRNMTVGVGVVPTGPAEISPLLQGAQPAPDGQIQERGVADGRLRLGLCALRRRRVAHEAAGVRRKRARPELRDLGRG